MNNETAKNIMRCDNYGDCSIVAELEAELAACKDATEIKTSANTMICTCGRIFNCDDDYDTLGSDSGVCCPDCGNEKFQSVAELQAELAAHAWIPVSERLPEYNDKFLVCYHGGGGKGVAYFSATTKIKEWYDNYPRTVAFWMPIPPLPEQKGEHGSG